MKILIFTLITTCSLLAVPAFASEQQAVGKPIEKSISNAVNLGKQSFGIARHCGIEVLRRLADQKSIQRDQLSKSCLAKIDSLLNHPEILRAKEFWREKTQAEINQIYDLRAYNQSEESIELSGKTPNENSAVLIYVQAPDADFDPGLTEPAAIITPGKIPTWSQQVYFRSGAGEYQIRIYRADNFKAQSLKLYLFEMGQFSVTAKPSRAPELIPSFAVQSHSSEIAQIARELTISTSSQLAASRSIHEWVSQNIAYDDALVDLMVERGRPLSRPVSALATLKSRKGICSDFSALTAAMLRSVGIPARVIVGVGLTNSRTTSISAWATTENHAWLQAYVDGRWINLDPTFDSAQTGTQYFDTPDDVFGQDHRSGRVQTSW